MKYKIILLNILFTTICFAQNTETKRPQTTTQEKK